MDSSELYQLAFADHEAAPGSTLQDLSGVMDGYNSYAPAPYTEEDMVRAVVPGYEPQAEEVVSEEPVAPQLPATPEDPTTGASRDVYSTYDATLPPDPAPVVNTSQGSSVAVSQKGFDNATHNQIVKKGGRVDQRVAAKKAEVASEYAPHYANLEQANLNEDVAIKQLTQRQMDLNDAQVMTRRWEQEDAEKNRIKEEEIAAKSAARIQEARARFEASLADFRSSGVNPNQLFDSMGKGDRAGTLAAVFIHDFLGAKGIKTSALATLDKAIDRNIDAQIHAIKMKGEVSQGFKQLWDMQRAESASDAEARARVKVFMLEAQKAKAAEFVGKFNTQLIQAQGTVAMAALDKKLAQEKFEVFKHMQQAGQAITSQEYQRHAQEVNAALQARQIRLQEQAAQRAQLQAEAAKKDAERKGLLADIDTGEYNRRIKDHITPEEQRKTREAAIAMEDLKNKSKDLIDLYEKAKAKKGSANVSFGEVGRLVGMDQAKINQLYYDIFITQAKLDSGMALNQTELENQAKRLPPNLAWTQADVSALTGGFMKNGIRKYNTILKHNTEDVLPGQVGYGERAGKNFSGTDSYLRGKGVFDAAGADKSPTVQAAAGLARPDAFDESHESTVDAAVKYGATPNQDWEKFNQAKMQSTGHDGTFKLNGNAPAYATAISVLAERAKLKGADGKPSVEAKQAREILNDYANGQFHQTIDAPGEAIDPNSNQGRLIREFTTFKLRELNPSPPTSIDRAPAIAPAAPGVGFEGNYSPDPAATGGITYDENGDVIWGTPR